MKKTLLLAVAITALCTQFASAHSDSKILCKGFMEENNVRIPSNQKVATGITEQEFNAVLDRIDTQYRDEVAARGATLKINRLWKDATANASAEQNGTTWTINMYGGLARHQRINADGFALVACHEMGHHLGGAPKVSKWASNEGQADYYANLKCFRRYAANDNNEEIVASLPVNEFVKKECETEFTNRNDQLICIREANAGLTLARVLQELRNEKIVPDFETPDKKVTIMMVNSHPPTQCRLDTYFNGSRCPVVVSEAVSEKDYKPGTCDQTTTFNTGSRPRCWFRP